MTVCIPALIFFDSIFNKNDIWDGRDMLAGFVAFVLFWADIYGLFLAQPVNFF